MFVRWVFGLFGRLGAPRPDNPPKSFAVGALGQLVSRHANLAVIALFTKGFRKTGGSTVENFGKVGSCQLVKNAVEGNAPKQDHGADRKDSVHADLRDDGGREAGAWARSRRKNRNESDPIARNRVGNLRSNRTETGKDSFSRKLAASDRSIHPDDSICRVVVPRYPTWDWAPPRIRFRRFRPRCRASRGS